MASSAPSKEVSRDLKTKLKRAASKPMGFFYCAGGEDGDPALIIDKQVKSAAAKIRKSATVKQFAMGTVQFGHGTCPCFILDTAKPPKLERHLQTFFGKGVPALKKADIYTRREWEEDSKPDSNPDSLPDFDDNEENQNKDEPEAKLDEAVESLGWRASQTHKHAKRFVKVCGDYIIGDGKNTKKRMSAQLEKLDTWAGRVLESAEATVKALESGQIEKSTTKKPIKDLGASRKMLWGVHQSISADHGGGYPSKSMKTAAAKMRSKIKKAHIMLTKA